MNGFETSLPASKLSGQLTRLGRREEKSRRAGGARRAGFFRDRPGQARLRSEIEDFASRADGGDLLVMFLFVRAATARRGVIAED